MKRLCGIVAGSVVGVFVSTVSAQEIDRTVLPIHEPPVETITTLDAAITDVLFAMD